MEPPELPPELPPASPPPLPTPPPAPRRSFLVQALVAFGIAFALFLVFSFGRVLLLAVQKRATPVAVNPRTLPPQPLNEAQKQNLREFAEQLVETLEDDDPSKQAKLIDLPGLIERIAAGTRLPDAARRTLLQELKRQPTTILRYLAGSNCRIVRIGERNGYPTLVLRSESDEQGISYCDLLVRPRGNGFGIIDLYGYTFGAMASEEMRDATLKLMAADKRIARQLKIENLADSAVATALLETSRAIESEDWEGTVRLIRSYSASVRNQRAICILHLRALSNLQDKPEYQAELGELVTRARSVFGTNAAPDMLFYDVHCQRKDYAAAVRDIDSTLAIIGRDAGLLNLKADAALRGGMTAVGRQCLEEAETLEADYPNLIDLRIKVLATERKFTEAADYINRHFKSIQAKPTEDMFDDELYVEFRKTPGYKALFPSR